jgi:dihydropteroate synthase
MGILNVTPDSFADGGAHLDPDRAVEAALALEAEGADVIDVGGESTRPGADELSVAVEAGRINPVLKRLVPQLGVPVSVDTYKGEVARQALDHGAALVNDVSGLRYDPGLATVVAAAGVPLVLMHMRGRSRDMYRQATYGDVVQDVVDELAAAVGRAVEAGISRDQLILDPGLGFAKRPAHSFAVLARLDRLSALDRPILVGPSRKSFLQEALGECPPDDREWGTAAAVASAVLLGAHIVRVHGVQAMTQIVRVTDRLRTHGAPVPAGAGDHTQAAQR